MRSFALLRQQPLRLTSTLPARSFTSAARLRLKEDKEQSAQEIEHAKRNQAHSSRAREELKSQSEASVAADQEHVKDHDKHMEKLQKETAKASEEEKGKR